MIIDNLSQGDICLVNFDPTIGDEIKKIRPAMIISSDVTIGFDLKIVVPITSWRDEFSKIWWLVKLQPNAMNNLDKVSAVNCYQMRYISIDRIIRVIGREDTELENIIATSQNCIEI